ncbi:MAG: cellulose binding domain-containing protein, partial [Patescibacteria group bacterium]
MFNKIKNRITGFSGIEILLAGSIMALVITSLLGLLFYSNDALNKDNSNLQASLIASQALEVVSTIRDRGFDNLIDGVHGLSFSGGEWSFLGESDQVGDFTRVITISTVSENVKKIAVLVTWFKSPGRLVSISEYRYLTNWQETEQASLIDVAINIDSDWEDGYCATVTLTTESITPIIWDLDIILDTYPKNGIVNNVWDANWSFAEPILSVSGLAGNETIVFGSSINFTYCADREII